ncbi:MULTISPECIES: ABC transporter permease [unclassified Rhodanobacter]|uniref:Transport permease protein n=1 Tax=Rhodanobacter humi TaxID=1888173 RepID=A0ABV4ASS8_9GAMM
MIRNDAEKQSPMDRLSKIPSPLQMFSAFVHHGSLTWEMSKREVLGRYRGATFGLLWTVLNPFIMLTVYSMAFGSIMKSRWPQVNSSHANYTLILYVGLIMHGFFSECFSRAPTLITANPNYVKRIIFPLDILPWPMALSALFHAFMNVIVFVVFSMFMVGSIPWTIIFLPLVLLPLFILSLGVAWGMASLGVYFRDISQVTAPLATAMLFLSSAIMPLEMVPQSYRFVFEANPLTFIIDQSREVALWGHFPDWFGLALYAAKAIVFTYFFFVWFRLTQKGFADVI